MLDWSKIDTVLLDMDGTLLDLHFDNHFWLEVIPARFAKQQGISLAAARHEIAKRYEAVAGTLNWYCLDYWQQELNLPIMTLKKEIKHLIQFRPDAEAFLAALKHSDKRVVMLTNAHPDSLSLKVEMTALDVYFDGLISTHEFGVSKEHPSLWKQVEKHLEFDPKRTLFVDDSVPILHAAERHGIGHLLAIANPDSKKAANTIEAFPAITDYRSVLPIS